MCTCKSCGYSSDAIWLYHAGGLRGSNPTGLHALRPFIFPLHAGVNISQVK